MYLFCNNFVTKIAYIVKSENKILKFEKKRIESNWTRNS